MEEHKARCNEIQVLKFGQLIDLEMVDKVCLVSYLVTLLPSCLPDVCTTPQRSWLHDLFWTPAPPPPLLINVRCSSVARLPDIITPQM